jgi:hypothetical protein
MLKEDEKKKKKKKEKISESMMAHHLHLNSVRNIGTT